MPGLLDSQSIPIPCPNCRRKTSKTVSWLKANRHFTCACGTRINVDSRQLVREFGKVDSAVDQLKRRLNALNKRK